MATCGPKMKNSQDEADKDLRVVYEKSMAEQQQRDDNSFFPNATSC
ncbi:hypothetical protein [Sphingobacterium daejeonense]